MSTGLKIVRNDLKDRLDKMIDQSNMKGAAARIYPVYQRLQTKRFETENASEGARWTPIKPQYADYKLKRFKSAPGGGRKTLIATSSLAGAVIGPGSPFRGVENHIALFTKYSMQIKINLSGNNSDGKRFDYPQYVAETRPFFGFSGKSLQILKDELKKYLLGNF